MSSIDRRRFLELSGAGAGAVLAGAATPGPVEASEPRPAPRRAPFVRSGQAPDVCIIGAGAFGQVWVGRDLNTGRPVAVKFYMHRGGVNWSLLSREVKNLVQMSADKHVVQVLEVGWDGDPPYYVMEYIPSGSLED